MGQVICVFRIMPKSPEDFEKIKTEAQKLNPTRLEEEPIAFGLKALKFTTIIEDAAGTIEKLENQLESIEGVQTVENIMTTRSL
jgi:elongation factor 1-beta